MCRTRTTRKWLLKLEMGIVWPGHGLREIEGAWALLKRVRNPRMNRCSTKTTNKSDVFLLVVNQLPKA